MKKKSFIRLAPGHIFLYIFWRNLRKKLRILSQNFRLCAEIDLNYEKIVYSLLNVVKIATLYCKLDCFTIANKISSALKGYSLLAISVIFTTKLMRK
jgi:hypothetical protein